jgi:LacI family transcriptional regulator
MAAVGYVYNRRAAEMRSLRSKTLGLIVANVRNPYFAELTMAVEERAHESGLTLILGCSADDVQRQRELLRAMAEQRVDGVLLLPASNTTPADLTRALADPGVPHVLVARSVPGYDCDYVGADNRAAGRLLGEHLLGLGARKVAFIGGVASSVPRRDRIDGLLAGLGPDVGGLVADLPSEHDAAFEPAGIVGAALMTVPRPDVLVAYNDMYAFGIMSALRAQGLEPGVDVMVASFDNVPEAAMQYPGLTTVDGFPLRVGASAAELLLEAIKRGPEEPVGRILVEPVLRVRSTTTSWSHQSAQPTAR